MPRYVDVDKAYEIARTYHKDFARSMADLTSLREVLEDALEDTPTADVVEVKHGEWIENEDDFWIMCSQCCIELLDDEMDIIDNFKYCPACGAKMDKRVSEKCK